MTAPKNRRPRQTFKPPARKTQQSSGSSLLQLLKRIPGVILAIGGVATAIGAVLALILTILPSHAPQNVARFISVQPLSQVALGEYQQRSAAPTKKSAERSDPQHRGAVAAVLAHVSAPLIQQNTSDTADPSPSAGGDSPTPARAHPRTRARRPARAHPRTRARRPARAHPRTRARRPARAHPRTRARRPARARRPGHGLTRRRNQIPSPSRPVVS